MPKITFDLDVPDYDPDTLFDAVVATIAGQCLGGGAVGLVRPASRAVRVGRA